MERFADDGSRVRDTVDAVGHVPVLSGLAGGLLTVEVSTAPRPLPPEVTGLGDSEWSGMSGGPVVADGLLLAVVTEQAPRAGPSAITATPLTALEADPGHPRWGPGVTDPSAWWARLGVPGVQALRKLPDSSGLGVSRPVRLAPRPVFLAGREDLLAGLDGPAGRQRCGTGPRVVALCGLGGAGKTSVAVEYAHRHLAGLGVVWQFPAEDPTAMAAEFGELAALLGARDVLAGGDPVAAVHAVLAARPGGWLLIFDNAPDAAAVAGVLPPAGDGQVIITSQNPHWPGGQARRGARPGPGRRGGVPDGPHRRPRRGGRPGAGGRAGRAAAGPGAGRRLHAGRRPGHRRLPGPVPGAAGRDAGPRGSGRV